MFVVPFALGGPVGHAVLTFISTCTDVTTHSDSYKSNEKNVQLAQSKIENIIHKKEEKKFFKSKNIFILETPHQFASASASNLFGKAAILISPKLIQADEQAAAWLLKHELAHIKYNDALIRNVIPLIGSLAAAILTLSTLDALPATCITYLTSVTSQIAYARFCEARADRFANHYSTAEELQGGKRFFLTIPYQPFHHDLVHPTPSSRLEKIECALHTKVTKKTKRTRKKHAEMMIAQLRMAQVESALSLEELQNKEKCTKIQVLFFNCVVPSRSFPLLLNTFTLCKKIVQKRMENPVSFLPFCKVARKTGNFHKRYVFLKQIGTGSHSTVYLAKDHQNEFLAIKKYKITDQNLLHAFSTKVCKDAGMTEESYIKNLAAIEKEVGRRTDHPNLMKIREVHLESTVAYVVMEYVQGKVFEGVKDRLTGKEQAYSLETRTAFMEQFLSAIEHLLSKKILASDLYSDNIMISSEHTHLTLIDFGSYEIVEEKANMPMADYLREVEGIIRSIDKERGNAILETCKHLLPEAMGQKEISSEDLPILMKWVRTLQQELSRSF